MKTYNADTVLYKLRVSSFSPSPDTVTLPTSGRTQKQKTTVFNGVSANSWLLPIGICERDQWTTSQTSVSRPKSRNGAVPSEGLEPGLEQSKTSYDDTKNGDQGGEENTPDCGRLSENDSKDSDLCTDSSPQTTSKTRSLTGEEFDALWKRTPKRPQHTGNVFIVRKRNVPEGIGKNEYLQGRHLRSKVEELEDGEQQTSIKLQPRPFTAPGHRQGRSSDDKDSCTRAQRPFSHTGVRRGRSSLEKTLLHSVPLSSNLDLVVTSLTLRAVSDSVSTPQSEHCLQNDEDRPCSRVPPRPKTVSSTTSKNRAQGDALDTIEGIKRDYMRRAKSAPPKVRSLNTPNSLQCDVDGNYQRGPSLYWRARSAYHKKLMTYGPDDGADPNEQTQNIRGSLWRPLIVGEDGGLMQHSAGCPYKCKGCFKACLVSEDYLQKARAQKELREKAQVHQARSLVSHGRPVSVTSKYRAKVKDPQNIVSIALARSQPLYQLVHGNKSGSENQGNRDQLKNEENADKKQNESKDEPGDVSNKDFIVTDDITDTKLKTED